MPTTAELIEKLRELGEKTPETRSKRVQLLLTPSMFDALKALSVETGLSVNEIINVALSEYLTVTDCGGIKPPKLMPQKMEK